MRFLYIDIDSLRPDHLGCYGYHRDTSPHIDRLAREGVRFANCHTTDAPCLPSRTALMSGRAGIHTGVIGHGGTAATPFNEGPGRAFSDRLARGSWMGTLRQAGYSTHAISPFAQRHGAWWWYAGFDEIRNTGHNGQETADQVAPQVLEWLQSHGQDDNWFLYVNAWDPHAAYRTPDDYGHPFEGEPIPEWLTEEVRRKHFSRPGPHSAQEMRGFSTSEPGAPPPERYPRQPIQATSMEEVRRMFDGYDTAVRYIDDHVGQIVARLKELGIYDETVIVISADHGENLGELNVYSDHHTADQITTHLPMIVRWPGKTDHQQGRVDEGFLYHFDLAATLTELAGATVPDHWDAVSFASSFDAGRETDHRSFLVVSQGAWTCQRGVRFRHGQQDYICIRTYHDGYHAFPDVMLFNVSQDPYEQHDLAGDSPELVGHAMRLLDEWLGRAMRTATTPQDPMWTVLHEGGPYHTRGRLPAYLRRLRDTGRGQWADELARRHPAEA